MCAGWPPPKVDLRREYDAEINLILGLIRAGKAGRFSASPGVDHVIHRRSGIGEA